MLLLGICEPSQQIRQLLCTNLLPVLPPQPLSMECARLYYLLPALIFNPPELEAMVAYMKAFLALDPVTKSVIGTRQSQTVAVFVELQLKQFSSTANFSLHM